MTSRSAQELAVAGGTPVYSAEWPRWPQMDARSTALLRRALESGRWAISGESNGEVTYEHRFARAFADYCGVSHCVPTANGTGALAIAYEALGLSRGSEIVVPGLTWVACASSAAAAGLVPELADVDERTLCASLEAVEAAVTPRTEAVLAVHYACNTVDMPALMEFARRRGLAVIEDCAQAHGARINGQPVGSFGHVATFSMQDSKVLSSGEGGACVTDDPELAAALEQYRSDGRRYSSDHTPGLPTLTPVGKVQGRNLCLSEMQSAILLGRLAALDAELERRRETALRLDTELSSVPGVSLVEKPAHQTLRSYYRYCFFVDPDVWRYGSVREVVRELSAELGLPLDTLHEPLNRAVLYNPMLSPDRFDAAIHGRLDPKRFDLPHARRAYETCVSVPHRALLADDEAIAAIVEAVGKVYAARSAG